MALSPSTLLKLRAAVFSCSLWRFPDGKDAQIVAFNLLWPRTSPLGAAYLRSLWNLLDFLAISTSLLSLAFQDSHLRVFKAIRTTRAIRPLRILSRSPGMKQVSARQVLVFVGCSPGSPTSSRGNRQS